MKVIIATLLVLATLIGFGTYSFNYLDRTADELLSIADSIEKSVAEKNWDEARADFPRFESVWKKSSRKWAILIDHIELDQINTSMSKVEKYVDTKDIPGFMTEMAELKLLLKHVPEKEALNIKNIL